MPLVGGQTVLEPAAVDVGLLDPVAQRLVGTPRVAATPLMSRPPSRTRRIALARYSGGNSLVYLRGIVNILQFGLDAHSVEVST